METTGSILKSYMKNRIKRDDYAKLLGITPQYLSNILNDKRKASSKLLEKLIVSMNVTEDDQNKIKEYETSRQRLQEYEIIMKKITKEGLKSCGKDKIYSKGGKLIETLTNLSLFVELDYSIFGFKKGDILVFTKCVDKNFKSCICILNDKLCKVKKVDKNYIVESDEIKILKNISIEHILLYTIRREDE